MSLIACDFFGFSTADGPTNMARDDALLAHAATGVVGLRFYGWDPPTLSLGYFQPAAERLSGLPFVRRTTGGGAIVHHYDLTYALALPVELYRTTERPWPCRMHDAIRAALAEFGVTGLACAVGEVGRGAFLCFQHVTAGDVLIGTDKVVGSAQRKRAAAVLVHGSILLAASPHAPQLPGVRELSGIDITAVLLAEAVARQVACETGWTLTPSNQALAADATTYSADAWNLKR